MKRIILSAAALLCVIISSGQPKRFTIGAEGGISIANLSTNISAYNDIYKNRTGYVAGIALQYNFKNKFSIRSGAMIEQKGTTSHIIFTDNAGNQIGTGTLSYDFGYLVVPLLLRYTIGDKINVFLNAGPYWAALLTAKRVIDGGPDSSASKIDVTADYKNTDAGISGGIGASAVFNEIIILSI